MNQPASKDPSMDEILSSIRQIIADDEPPADEPEAAPEVLATEITGDDEADGLSAMIEEPAEKADPAPEPPKAKPVQETKAVEEEPLALGAEQMLNPPKKPIETPSAPEEDPEDAPLALSADQMLNPPAAKPTEAADDLVRAAPAPEEFVAEFGDDVSEDVQMVVPDDIAFINDEDTEEEDTEESVAMDLDDLVADVDLASLETEQSIPVEAEPVVEEETLSPLPDQNLTTEMSEELLEPATKAAASSAFSQLDALTLSAGTGQTVEDLIREMLRPMLKGWLDENLPGVVEKLVQREIERVSRGKR